MGLPASAVVLFAALATLPCQANEDITRDSLPLQNQSSGKSNRTPKNILMIHNDYKNKINADINVTGTNNKEIIPKNNVHNIIYFIDKQSDSNNKLKDRYKRTVSVENKVTFSDVKLNDNSRIEKRRKSDMNTNTQLLNYIFDTHTSTHQHKNYNIGPGNNIYAAAAPRVNALVGTMTQLDCKVDSLHDKLVSWVRRKSDDEAMELLTIGTQRHTADIRYSSKFIPPDMWRLQIQDVRQSDAAHYDCQLSAHPPRTARITLIVPEVSIKVVDGAGAEVREQVCEEGSTVALRCEVRGLRMESGPALLWYRRNDLLNDDITRGGISVKTELGAYGASSILRVARVRADDAGSYTCTVSKPKPLSVPPAQVVLHVIKGESLAELHQGGDSISMNAHKVKIVLLVLIFQIV